MNLKKRRIKFHEDLEPHDILLDKLAKENEEKMGISEKKLEVPLSRSAILSFYFFSLILFFILLSKVFSLQVIEAKKFSELAKNNKSRTNLYQPIRGVIYDKSGKQLVFNEPSFDLVLDKKALPVLNEEKDKILKEISKIINISHDELTKEIEKSKENKIIISKNLSYEILLIIETKINQKELAGFSIQQNIIRNYKDGNNFSHVIGYMGKIDKVEYKSLDNYSITSYIGKSGLEKSYEEVLRGEPGIIQIEKDSRENVKSEKVISEPKAGKSLILSLDSELQIKIKEELEKKLEELGAKKAVGIAMDPKTGGVLALVSLPSFDNNLFQEKENSKELKDLLYNPNHPIFNRAISGRYLVGSTIKPLLASAALQENLISPAKQIYSAGSIQIPHRYDPEIVYTFHDNAVHGWVDMRKAIAQSSNVYFFTIGGGYGDQKGLGPSKIKEYLDIFGWTKKTGIDLFGEVAGFVPDREWKKRSIKEDWLDGDTYNMSIGQGFLQITPLEVITSFLPIANGGKLMKPYVVEKIIEGSASSPQIIKEFSPEIIKENFIEQENLQVVREGMRQAVTGLNSPRASVKLLNSLPVSSAAKTGTAELGNNSFNNWITVFAPYENPEIIMTLVIENVKGVQAAVIPVANEVLRWYFETK